MTLHNYTLLVAELTFGLKDFRGCISCHGSLREQNLPEFLREKLGEKFPEFEAAFMKRLGAKSPVSLTDFSVCMYLHMVLGALAECNPITTEEAKR